VRPVLAAHTGSMSEASEFDLPAYSAAIAGVIENSGAFVVAVKSAAYRVASGVVIRKDLIAVNNHALRREGTIPAYLPDGTETEASIVGRDPRLDVAVLKVEGGTFQPPAPEEDARQRAGELAIVVGRTLDSGLSASLGIIGAVGGPRRTWRGGELNRFLRLDVNLYPSQVGAAVVSARGLFIGMATPAVLRHSTLAVPHEALNQIADELLQEGRIRQGYLGLGLQPVAIPENLQTKFEHVAESGLIVLSVEPGTSASEAGLQLGDILLSAANTPLTDTETLLGLLRGRGAVGTAIRFFVIRGGNGLEVEVRIAERRNKRS